ncbi:MAG TPA: hypothetical protein VMF68_10460 [Spirochaetia bacterium]|nr:hypothetical protein [Spirochaetia bacterium]
MKQLSLFVIAVFLALVSTVIFAADQAMPAAPAASGKMMEEKNDQGMAMKMDEKTSSGMPMEGKKTDGMKSDGMKKDEMGMGMKPEKDNMPMEKQ